MPEAIALLQQGITNGVHFERFAFSFSGCCAFCREWSRAGVRMESCTRFHNVCPICFGKAMRKEPLEGLPMVVTISDRIREQLSALRSAIVHGTTIIPASVELRELTNQVRLLEDAVAQSENAAYLHQVLVQRDEFYNQLQRVRVDEPGKHRPIKEEECQTQ